MDDRRPDTCYISVACNSEPQCLDWGNNNLLCYGACHGVAICELQDSTSGVVRQRLTSHSDHVTSVCWIKRSDHGPESQFVSTSADKTAIVWSLRDDDTNMCAPTYKLTGHTDTVNVAHAVYFEIWQSRPNDQPTMIATGSSDCTIRIWQHSDNEVTCRQIIHLGLDYPLTLKIASHSTSQARFLIYGGSDTKLHIYLEQKEEFVKVLSLLGHEDWIREIDTTTDGRGDILIASCAQDCFIRIWKLSLKVDDPNQAGDRLKVKGNSFSVEDPDGSLYHFNVEVDAVLAGHENWIYGVQWHPAVRESQGFVQPMKLLSSSMDKTMIVWELDDSLGVWLEKVRVGEVGGNSLGFLGSRFSPDGQSIIANGFQGAFHLWNWNSKLDKWEPGVVVGGHFAAVQDLDWDKDGQFVISVSSDQTTRLHAPWRRNGNSTQWHEIARPQVHGYDMTCITVIDSCKFASGADEKVLRAFQAPRNFIENFNRLCSRIHTENLVLDNHIPEGASVPALGLSNKAVFEKSSQLDTEARHPKDLYPEAYFVSTTLTKPPTEETLLQNTLWPEIHKMYGHGYEIYSATANNSGTLLASACKASRAEHAKIIVWSTATWKEVGQLAGHTLTVTQMEFSPCDRYLLSVSRDRTWCLFELTLSEDSVLSCFKVAYSDKKTCLHTRIIWSCAWSKDGHYFATASRDKKVIVWGKQQKEVESSTRNWGAVASPLVSEDSVTAVDFAPLMLNGQSYLLAIGQECGTIQLYKWTPTEWSLCYTLERTYLHHLTVRRLRFRPILGRTGCDGHSTSIIQLASCGVDNCLFVIDIPWNEL